MRVALPQARDNKSLSFTIVHFLWLQEKNLQSWVDDGWHKLKKTLFKAQQETKNHTKWCGFFVYVFAQQTLYYRHFCISLAQNYA